VVHIPWFPLPGWLFSSPAKGWALGTQVRECSTLRSSGCHIRWRATPVT